MKPKPGKMIRSRPPPDRASSLPSSTNHMTCITTSHAGHMITHAHTTRLADIPLCLWHGGYILHGVCTQHLHVGPMRLVIRYKTATPTGKDVRQYSLRPDLMLHVQVYWHPLAVLILVAGEQLHFTCSYYRTTVGLATIIHTAWYSTSHLTILTNCADCSSFCCSVSSARAFLSFFLSSSLAALIAVCTAAMTSGR